MRGRFDRLLLVAVVLLPVCVTTGYAQSKFEDDSENYESGLIALEQQDFQAAVDHFLKAIVDDPESGNAWHEWGYSSHMLGRSDDAISGFAVAAIHEETRANALYNLACAHSLADNAPLAQEYLRQAFSAGFDEFELVASDSDLDNLRKLPAFSELVARAKAGVATDAGQTRRDAAVQYLEAGRVLLGAELFDIARKSLQRSVRKDRLDGSGLLLLGFANHRLGDYEKAVKYTTRAAEFEESRTSAIYNLACYHAAYDHPEKALAELERAVRVGFNDVAFMESDSDLDSIRNAPRYRKLLARMSGQRPRTNDRKPTAGFTGKVVIAQRNVKAKAGKEIVGIIPQGTKLTVQKENDGYYLVEVPSNGRKGWVKKAELQSGSGTADGRRARSLAGGDSGSASGESGNGLPWVNSERAANSERPDSERTTPSQMDLQAQQMQQAIRQMTESGQMANADAGVLQFASEMMELIPKVTSLGQQGRNIEAVRAVQAFIASNEPTLQRMPNEYANVLKIAGNLYFGVQDFAQARDAFDKASKMFVSGNGNANSQYADFCEMLAHAHLQLLNFDRAEDLYREAISVRKRLGGESDSAHARSIVVYASYLGARGRYDEAKPLFEKGMRVLEANHGKNNPLFGGVTIQYANYLSSVGEVKEAESLLQTLIEQSSSGAPGEGNTGSLGARLALAGIYRLHSRFDEAGELVQTVLNVLKGNELGEFSAPYYDTLISLGQIMHAKGDFSAAETVYLRARDLAATTSGIESFNYPTALASLGELYTEQGDYAEAESLLQESLKIREKVIGEDHPLTASTLVSLASVHEKMGDRHRVEPLYQRAIEIQDRTFGEGNLASAVTLNALGVFHFGNGDDDKAEPLFRQCLDILKTRVGEDSLQFALVTQNLGEVYMRRGDLEKATSFFDLAMPLIANSADRVYGQSLQKYSQLLRLKGDLDASDKAFRQSNRLLVNSLGPSHPATAQGMLQHGLLMVQRKDVQRSTQQFDLYRKAVLKHTNRVLPGLTADQQMAYLQTEFRPGLVTSLSLGFQQRENQRAASLSAGWLLNGKLISQEVMAESALLTSSEAAPLVRQLRSTRNQLSKLTLSLESDPTKRQRQIETIADLESRQKGLIRKIADASKRGDRSSGWVSVGQFRESIPFDATVISIARFSPNAIDRELMTNADGELEDAQAVPADEQHYVAWAIPSVGAGDIQIVDLGPADAIDQEMSRLREGIGDTLDALRSGEDEDVADRVEASAKKLYAMLIEPVRPVLKDSRELLISPDANLWLLPFNALVSAEGKFLVEEFELRYLLSGRELVGERPPRALVTPPVIYANPDFDMTLAGESGRESSRETGRETASQVPMVRGRLTRALSISRFDPLPGTAEEARQIEPIVGKFAGEKANVLMGKDATESSFKALHRPSALILSTHGYFLNDVSAEDYSQSQSTTPERSSAASGSGSGSGDAVAKVQQWNPLLRCGLALAGCNDRSTGAGIGREDGVLTGLEIVGCDFRGTEIVVLSACETGLGKTHVGEGVVGLRQSFQLAGADTVVASLWQVPDRDTLDFMHKFWKYLAEGNSRSQAVRLAQLDLIEAFREDDNVLPHAFRWAAFTVTGR